jgi:signal transduction histidine kinase/FixJ family two-component response regulator
VTYRCGFILAFFFEVINISFSVLKFSSAGPVQELLDRAGGRAELLVRFCHARGYEVVEWNRAAAGLFALDPHRVEAPLPWNHLPETLAQYLAQALQMASGAPEEPMPNLAPTDGEAEQHYLAKLYYQGVQGSDPDQEEHWYFFCFQDSVNWLEHSQGEVNRKKLETIGELASGVAHDFNNLIMGIQANAEAMLAQPNMTPQSREGLVNIIRGCSTGASLTRSLLGYAKRQPLALSPFNLLDLVHDVTRIAGVASSKYRVVVSKDLAERSKPIMVVGSYSSLSHCVLNLIKNAREAMPEGGTINVLWEGDNDTAVITVADTGSGISEEDMARLFQPFFSTKKQGTGLGLAMVRGILQQHGGTVEVRSTVGVGTAVSLVWPRGEQPRSAPPLTVDDRLSTQRIVRNSTKIFTDSKQQSPENHFLIYVIDDDDLVREGLCSLLEHLGHRIESFGDPEIALQAILAAPIQPELVIVDYNMPGLNGIQFIGKYSDALADRDPVPTTQILLMSGMPPSDFEDFLARFTGLKVGLMEKPFSLETLRKNLADIQEERSGTGNQAPPPEAVVRTIPPETTKIPSVQNISP